MGYDLLEFSALKEYIQPLIASDVGQSALSDMAPCDSWEEARYRLALLKEMVALITDGKPPTMSSIADIRPLLCVKEGAVLEGQDIVKVSDVLADMGRLRAELVKAGGLLAETASRIESLEEVIREIRHMILPTGEISDKAHPLLKELRSRYRSIRASVLEKIERILERLKPKSVLMEEIITKRNDRYVIPVRHDYHMHLKGITHDYSRTNRTVYVEPLAVVEDNNTLNQIKAQIIEEEHKVLRELTSLVLQHTPEIRENLDLYARLDLVAACARWAIHLDASIPEISGEQIFLRGARHPILLQRLGRASTVPLDIRIPVEKDCLIITGPNAGGKTVALKTLGLLILMAKSGLAIPAHPDSVLAPVGNVWVEMDTSQDIKHDLSSFTAHALSLKHIYESTSPGDLVLLDEPGTGTDHDQGGALAVACIDALRKKGAKVVVTSHSDLVKLYAISSEGVENAATAFDDTGLKPLYALQYGVVGQSRAFEILESIHFPHMLIEDARGIAGRTGNTTLAQAIEDISRASSMRQQAAAELEEARRLKIQSEQVHRERERDKMSSALKYKRLIEHLEQLAKRPISATTVHEVHEVKKSVEVVELEQVLKEKEPAASLDVQMGSLVKLKGTQQEGEVVELSQNTAEVLFGTKRLQVGLDQIVVIEHPPGSDVKKVNVRFMRQPPPVLPVKVVGLRVDEALPIVERAIDRAMLSGQERLEIIHGAGTGRLKKAIREYLKELPCVKSFFDAALGEGGGNKTIVVLGTR
jgi:DNA mismatch repair protein MutS2